MKEQTSAHLEKSRDLLGRADKMTGGQAVGPRQRVIHQRAGQKLAGVAVVGAFFPQRLTDALRDAAVALAMDQHGVHGSPAIIDGSVPNDFDNSGVGIDLHFAYRAGVCKNGRLMT